jgi:hypothetical protein
MYRRPYGEVAQLIAMLASLKQEKAVNKKDDTKENLS